MEPPMSRVGAQTWSATAILTAAIAAETRVVRASVGTEMVGAAAAPVATALAGVGPVAVAPEPAVSKSSQIVCALVAIVRRGI
jgi:hypothetical protein